MFLSTEEIEHWTEQDLDMDADFIEESENRSDIISREDISREETDVDGEQRAITWWVVMFTCVFQTLHCLPNRAVQWVLQFFFCLLTVLGRYSTVVAKLAEGFPRSIYLRGQYLKDNLLVPKVEHMVVCTVCHSLYSFKDCFEKKGTLAVPRLCSECLLSRQHSSLLRQVITSQGTKKFYPYCVYPASSLICSLQVLLLRPEFCDQCETWRTHFKLDASDFYDVYDGNIWADFLFYKNSPFLAQKNSLGLMMNIDWFQPYKHRTYSIGVIYLVVMNLPREIRFKRENIIIVGLLPGPSEPPLTINTYLTPLVSDLILLWKGYTFKLPDNNTVSVRCALLCVACDLPAGRKVCGFLSHTANFGCSRCYKNFGTGTFGKHDYSGFDRETWANRTIEKHRKDIDLVLKCSRKTEKQQKESEVGARYSCLLQLPYFNAVRMLIVDPMHNLYLGTAKRMFKIWKNRGIINEQAMEEINGRIRLFYVPPNAKFSRLPSPFEAASLTAEQWMVWVNYYSLYCLYELLPLDHYECWRHFVLASRLLSKPSISKEMVILADGLLLRFCRKFQDIYGHDAVTPNMHLHCHLASCVQDFGPTASFWCFSFERMNGILGNQPNNNRSIEVQLMQRFMEDNAHLQLLQLLPSGSSEINQLFCHSVHDHALSFYSVRHLDSTVSRATSFSSGFRYVPALKHKLSVFCRSEVEVLVKIYHVLYPLLSIDSTSLPRSYKKMKSVTIRGHEICSGQYVSAKAVFQFRDEAAEETILTAFRDPSLRPAKIDHFCIHSFHVDNSVIVHGFAAVSWPLHHPVCNTFGTPYQVWCSSVYECGSDNLLLPLENISSLLLTASYVIEEETVLVTVPLL